MFKFGNFPSKVPNNIDKKIIKYDNTLHYCYSPELPYINKKELNQQAVDDNYIKCFYCKTNILCNDIWHIVTCTKCNRLNRVPKDILEANKMTNYYGDRSNSIINANPLLVVIICPFCETHNQVSKVAQKMQCYKCENQVNLQKYHNNIHIDISNMFNNKPQVKVQFMSPKTNVNNSLKSNYYKEDLEHYSRRSEEYNNKHVKEIRESWKTGKETEEFIKRMNEKDKMFFKVFNTNELDSKQYYDEYVKKVYEKPVGGNKYYWLNR